MEPAILARHVSKRFGHRVVLRQIDLEVTSGEVVAVMGANGVGKTTLLRCLAGCLRPTAGEVRWFGQSPQKPAARRLVGLVPHDSPLYPNLTLEENLAFTARMYDVPDPGGLARRWLAAIGLASLARRVPNEVSRGMRQRMAVARALIHDPKILVADEPFSSLDADGAAWLARVVRDLARRGRAVLVATHDPRRAEELASRVVLLESGRAHEGRPAVAHGPCSSRAA